MKTSTNITTLLLVAMGLTLLSAHIDVAYEVIPHTDVDVCDLLLNEIYDASACSDDPDHGSDNCCESGCQHCSLPCCYGSAMVPAVALMVDANLTSDGRLAVTTLDVNWVDHDPLYHPPRA